MLFRSCGGDCPSGDLDADRKRSEGGEAWGCVKLVFSKTHPMSDDAAECAGALLYEYMRENFGEKAVSREHCFVVDVFANKCVTAPKSVIARMRDIVAACEEIARAWMALAA